MVLLPHSTRADDDPKETENSDYSSLKSRLRRRDGVILSESQWDDRPFMIKLSGDTTLHGGDMAAIDDAGLDVIGVSNSDIGGTYVHVSER